MFWKRQKVEVSKHCECPQSAPELHPWRGWLYVCEFHLLRKHSSCSSSQHLSPAPRGTASFQGILLSPLGGGRVLVMLSFPELTAAIFLVAICLKVFNSPPTASPLYSSAGYRVRSIDQRTLQASATEGAVHALTTRKLCWPGLAAAGPGGRQGRDCETCQIHFLSVSGFSSEAGAEMGPGVGVTAPEEKGP